MEIDYKRYTKTESRSKTLIKK